MLHAKLPSSTKFQYWKVLFIQETSLNYLILVIIHLRQVSSSLEKCNFIVLNLTATSFTAVNF